MLSAPHHEPYVPFTCAVLSLHRFSSPSCQVHPSLHLTACRLHSHRIHTQSAVFLLFAHQRTLGFRSLLLLAFFLLSCDIELNPDPTNFTVCTFNIRSSSSTPLCALCDLIYSHKPDLFCLTETWIKPTTTSAELLNCTPPDYCFISTSRNGSSKTSGGGTGFLVHELSGNSQLPTSVPNFSSDITPILRSLHWLKITERIEYKLLSLTYKVLTTTQPSYLLNLITLQPPRNTHSSSLVTLARPSISFSLRITDRSFQYASPRL